ncbi:MAG TPA: aminotransferase class III-fold pyridoxal phosphate-dependent enzyme [bacterium]|nr:aminotransferase class III-fold pyridoxal phosphate-dependent enzyme [bacterium]
MTPEPRDAAGIPAAGARVPPVAVLPAAERDRLIADTIERYRRYVNPGLARLFKFGGSETIEWAAEDCIVWDAHGREYVDCACGPAIFNIGHRHPRVLAAVRDQLDRMPMSVRTMPSAAPAELAERLAALTPGDLQYAFFCNSGAEAVEGALKLARLATGRPGFVAMQEAFHGKTLGALSATGREYYRGPFGPLVPGFTHVPFGDADAVERAVGPDTAAVILEPIQGEAGVIVPPAGYLRRVREICDRHHVLLIADEIQTGLGRTGRLFCVEHDDVVPDILTMAKALGGGVIPIGAFVARPALWEEFQRQPYIHSSTFGGNPLACRAAIATLEVLVEERLAERAVTMGERFLARLREIQGRYPSVIRDVRGRGLLLGVEFVHSDYALMVSAEAGHRGVITFYTLNKPEVIRVAPPLTITPDLIDRAAVGIDGAVAETDRLLASVRAAAVEGA